MITELKPLEQRVLVQRDTPNEVTTGGIFLPVDSREKPFLATVKGVGNGAKASNGERIAFHVKKGDRVLIRQTAGTPVTVRGKECLILNEDDILAKIA